MAKLRARLLVTSLLALAVTACSGGTSPAPSSDPVSPTSTSGTPAPSATPEPDAPAGQPGVTEPLPTGRLRTVATVPPPRYRDPLGHAAVGAAFGDDVIAFGDTRDFLWALDRDTGKPRWHVKMKAGLPGGDTVCAIVVTTRTVVLNHGGGPACGNFTVYDLDTGKVRDSYESLPDSMRVSGWDLPSNSDLVRMGEHTYWVDAENYLRRIEEDGSSSYVADLLSLTPGNRNLDVRRFTSIPGTDVFVARFRPPAGDDFDPNTLGVDLEDGLLVGFRLDGDGAPVRIWKQQVSHLVSRKVSPGHLRHELYQVPDLPGTVVDVARLKGKKTYRLRMLDPETGSLVQPGIRVSYDSLRPGGPGVPTFVEDYGTDNALVAGDGALFSPYMPPGGNDDTVVVRYDVSNGTEVWRWQLPGARHVGVGDMDVLAITPDRSAVYVLSAADFDNRIWELDYDTGQVRHSWRLPYRPPVLYDLDFADTFLDDGTVFQVAEHTDYRRGAIAALLRVE